MANGNYLDSVALELLYNLHGGKFLSQLAY